MNRIYLLTFTTLVAIGFTATVNADDASIQKNLATIKTVGNEGAGNPEAATAWKALVAEGTPAIVPTLKAFSGATPNVRNWLRTAAQTVAENTTKQGQKLPLADLTAYVKDATQDPNGRFAAYAIIKANSEDIASDILPGCLNDASVDIRRDAIAKKLKELGMNHADVGDYQKLFDSTRDKDQAEAIAKTLEEKFLTKTDLTAHFGYLTSWHVVGPFDSTEGKGFAVAYGPEKKPFKTDEVFDGKANAKLNWKSISTDAKYGMVNLNKEIGKNMDSVAYAFARVKIEKETPCEIRVGSKNAVQIFLNGKMLFAREAYHHGFSMDQHTGVGILKAGENDILLKVCQNNQKESWAQDWQFQLRVCDATGGKLPITPIKFEPKEKR